MDTGKMTNSEMSENSEIMCEW